MTTSGTSSGTFAGGCGAAAERSMMRLTGGAFDVPGTGRDAEGKVEVECIMRLSDIAADLEEGAGCAIGRGKRFIRGSGNSESSCGPRMVGGTAGRTGTAECGTGAETGVGADRSLGDTSGFSDGEYRGIDTAGGMGAEAGLAGGKESGAGAGRGAEEEDVATGDDRGIETADVGALLEEDGPADDDTSG